MTIEYKTAYNNFVKAYAKEFGLNQSQKVDFALALGEALETMAEEEE